MSSPPEEPELKAGHPPAVKAGGKRIATKHHHPPPPPAPTPEERAENEEYEDTTKERNNTKLVVSGVVTKGNADFTSEAVKVAHEKPMPQHDKRPPAHTGGKAGNIHIQQPRKH